MSRWLSAGTQFVSARARGLRRERLLEPLLRVRPPLTLLFAPSGYGKRVLAAQLAASTESVLWVDSRASWNCDSEMLSAFAHALDDGNPASPQDDLASLVAHCARAIESIRESGRLAVVLDHAPGNMSDECLLALSDLAERLPRESMIVVTARSSGGRQTMRSAGWTLGAADLLLDRQEALALCEYYGGTGISAGEAERIHAGSGGHVGLASLMVRRWLSIGESATSSDEEVASLVRSLARVQLDDMDRRILDCAAVIGEGRVIALSECTGERDSAGAMSRVSDVLPFVRMSGARAQACFSVQNTALGLLDSVNRLAASDLDCLRAAVNQLLASGNRLQAMEISVKAADASLLLQCLSVAGEALLAQGHEGVVREALGLLPTTDLVRNPQVLLLKAASHWERNENSEAVRLAGLAAQLSEHCGDDAAALKSRLLLARIRTSVGDYAGVTAETQQLLVLAHDGADSSVLAWALSSAMLASAFTADRAALGIIEERVAGLTRANAFAGQAAARLDICSGVVSGLLNGDWRRSASLFRRAALHEAGSTYEAVAYANLAGACLETGNLDEAQSAVDMARTIARAAGYDALLASTAVTDAVLRVLHGDEPPIDRVVADVVSETEHAGDTVTAVCALLGASCGSMLCRRFDDAGGYAERGLQMSHETGSPVFVWLAEMAQAEAASANGDDSWAASTARRILAKSEDLAAAALSTRARLVLSRVALRAGNLTEAVTLVADSRHHVETAWPFLMLASHLRAFPEMMGPVALAMGPGGIRTEILRLIPSPYAEDALEHAASFLPRDELDRLSQRMLGHPFSERVSASAAVAAASPTPSCTVRLFGGFEVRTPDGPVSDKAWVKRKSRLLFAMLASRPGKDVPREQLIEYLWPEMDEQRGLNNFYVAWSAMKHALSPEIGRDGRCPYVEHVRGVCRLVTDAVRCDLSDFEGLLVVVRKARSAGDTDAELAALHDVADIYRGELLPGDVYDDWFAPLRERCRHDFEDAMLRAAEIFEGRDEPQEALGLLRRALAHDPWREDLYQAALRLQITAGQRSAAIETYMLCRTRLVEDLGIDPSSETTRLYQHVLGMEE